MCTTMNELEKVVADYRSLKAMKEELATPITRTGGHVNMKEYGLSEEQLLALGEDPEKQEEPQEMWDGDFDFLMDFWF